MTPFASRPRFDAPAVAPHRILVRRMLIFALLLALTSGLRVVPDKLHAALTRALVRPLEIASTHSAPSIDGNPAEAVWRTARPVEIETSGTQSSMAQEKVSVRVRGLRDAENAYLLFEWQDPTRTQTQLPLIKTAQGWKRMDGERMYREDTFSVMLSRSSGVGHGPESATGGRYADVWHWRSVRNAPLGRIDDAGRITENWMEVDGGERIEPRRLPQDLPQLKAKMRSVKLDPSAGDDGQWWMDGAESLPYSEYLDTYPNGTVIPAVVIDKPVEGARDGVVAIATWKDGWWRMEVRRKLDPGTGFDLPIADGMFMWVAAFDDDAGRHTGHPRPVQIRLEK